MDIFYLNGEFVKREDAKVSVLDRGFMFADGVYEVIPAYHGKFFRFDAHLDRLKRSLKEIGIAVPELDWAVIFNSLLVENNSKTTNCSLYCQVTRGVMPSRAHQFNKEALKPTVVAWLQPMSIMPIEELEKGFKAVTTDDLRWLRCDIKSISLLPNIISKQDAIEHGVLEAIFVKNGNVTEGTASNVFIVRGDEVVTHPKENGILGGITREVVKEVVKDSSYKLVEEIFKRDDLYSADEVWVTSSTKNIAPITEVDGKPIGSGQVGSVWKEINSSLMKSIGI